MKKILLLLLLLLLLPILKSNANNPNVKPGSVFDYLVRPDGTTVCTLWVFSFNTETYQHKYNIHISQGYYRF